MSRAFAGVVDSNLGLVALELAQLSTNKPKKNRRIRPAGARRRDERLRLRGTPWAMHRGRSHRAPASQFLP
jgi:hypothetical protein